MKLFRTIITTGAAVVLFAAAVGAVEDTIESKIARVIVYPDRAKMTRTATVDLDEGTHSLLFENLPGGALEESIRAAAYGVEGMTFLGLSHATKQHLETPAAKVGELRELLIDLTRNQKQVTADRLATFEQLRAFVGALSKGATEDMSRDVSEGTVDVARWGDAYDFVGERSFQLADSIRAARQKLADIDEQIKLIRDEIGKLSTDRSRTTRTVDIDLELTRAGSVELEIEYIVPGASWKPLYDARIGDQTGKVQFTYYAEVSQKTDEDWSEVELTLSTALPSLGAGPGELSAWFLSQQTSSGSNSYIGPTGSIQGRLLDRETGRPVIGASVLVTDTRSGAMTDPSGMFQILRMTPGLYTLRIAHMSYNTLEVTDVAVLSGETQWVAQYMSPKVTESDETITVRGARQVMDKFVTDSRAVISEETIRNRPVQTVDRLLESVAGIQTTAEGKILVRGGQAGEVAYLSDGLPVGDPLGGSYPGMALVSGSIINSGAYPAVFKIKRPESIPSGAEGVRVTVAEWDFEGETRLISRPGNREGAYRLVTVTNQEAAPLTPGRVAMFAGTHFLGNTRFLQTIAPGEEFELPFGLDNHVTVKQKVIAFNKDRRRDNIRIEQTIQITVINYGDKACTIEVEASLPVSRDNRIKVRIETIQPEPTSRDDLGNVVWKLDLAPNVETVLTVPYRIDYPAGLNVAGL